MSRHQCRIKAYFCMSSLENRRRLTTRRSRTNLAVSIAMKDDAELAIRRCWKSSQSPSTPEQRHLHSFDGRHLDWRSKSG
jgi:hypothetical protein